MQASRIDRRSAANPVARDQSHVDASHVVRQSMAIQASLGTRSAVEFLKRHGVQGAVIQRVLTGAQVRSDDVADADADADADPDAGANEVALDEPRR